MASRNPLRRALGKQKEKRERMAPKPADGPEEKSVLSQDLEETPDSILQQGVDRATARHRRAQAKLELARRAKENSPDLPSDPPINPSVDLREKAKSVLEKRRQKPTQTRLSALPNQSDSSHSAGPSTSPIPAKSKVALQALSIEPPAVLPSAKRSVRLDSTATPTLKLPSSDLREKAKLELERRRLKGLGSSEPPLDSSASLTPDAREKAKLESAPKALARDSKNLLAPENPLSSVLSQTTQSSSASPDDDSHAHINRASLDAEPGFSEESQYVKFESAGEDEKEDFPSGRPTFFEDLPREDLGMLRLSRLFFEEGSALSVDSLGPLWWAAYDENDDRTLWDLVASLSDVIPSTEGWLETMSHLPSSVSRLPQIITEYIGYWSRPDDLDQQDDLDETQYSSLSGTLTTN